DDGRRRPQRLPCGGGRVGARVVWVGSSIIRRPRFETAVARAGNGAVIVGFTADCGGRSSAGEGLTVGYHTRSFRVSVAVLLWAFAVAPLARGQTFARLTVQQWHESDLLETYDHPIIQARGNVSTEPGEKSNVFFWDSF